MYSFLFLTFCLYQAVGLACSNGSQDCTTVSLQHNPSDNGFANYSGLFSTRRGSFNIPCGSYQRIENNSIASCDEGGCIPAKNTTHLLPCSPSSSSLPQVFWQTDETGTTDTSLKRYNYSLQIVGSTNASDSSVWTFDFEYNCVFSREKLFSSPDFYNYFYLCSFYYNLTSFHGTNASFIMRGATDVLCHSASGIGRKWQTRGDYFDITTSCKQKSIDLPAVTPTPTPTPTPTSLALQLRTSFSTIFLSLLLFVYVVTNAE